MGSHAEQQKKRERQLAICHACATHVLESHDTPEEWWFDPEDAATWPDWYRETPMGRHEVPPLDLAFGMAGRRFAVEHSTIEADARQDHKASIAKRIFDPLAERLSGCLPTPGHYTLSVEFMAIRSEKQARAACPALLKWVESTAPTLQRLEKWHSSRTEARKPDEAIPFHVSLSREFDWEGTAWNGKVHVFNLLPDKRKVASYRKERRDRMKLNLRSNLPKLQAWQKAGFITALVLDCSGMGLDGFEDSAEELLAELRRRKRLPEYVFFALANFYKDDAPLRVGWLYVLRQQGETIRDFDPRNKVDFDY